MAKERRVWRDLKLNTERPHTWAFYYFLKKMGDDVTIIYRGKDFIDVAVEGDF